MSDDNSTDARKAKARATSKEWRDANKEHVAAYNKAWQEANRERKAAQQKAHREADLEAARATERARESAKSGDAAARQKRYRQRHPDKAKASQDNYRKANPDKVRMRKRDWHRRNSAKINLQNKLRKYGLSETEFAEMVAACNGRCPCCKTPFSVLFGPKNFRPVIDHDHRKGFTREAVRGAICHQCNITIGHAADDPRILRACALHLERFEQWQLDDSRSTA
jgi:hypothetical protein